MFKIPTPFASHAFHPLDGFLQSLPYHLYPFIFPLNKVLDHQKYSLDMKGVTELMIKLNKFFFWYKYNAEN